MNKSAVRSEESRQSSSLPSTYSSSSLNSEDERLALLSDINALQALFPGVTPKEETPLIKHPNMTPAVFSKKFDYVMGIYRAVGVTFKGTRVGPSTPQWLLLTSFVIQQNASHYSAWKDRRDVFLQPSRLLTSTRDAFMAENGQQCCGDKSDSLAKVIQEWLPAQCDVQGPTGEYSVWRAIRWELKAMERFALMNPKNFQAWHHRGEMLREALMHANSAVTGSRSAFDGYLLTCHNMQFSDIDERVFCDAALDDDSKNYHAWLYRSWFVHSFPFLLHPPSWDSLLGGDQGTEDKHSELHAAPFRSFTVEEDWLHKCLQPIIPECPLSDELTSTAKRILHDCMNNSAWCHRFYVFEHDLIVPLIRVIPPQQTEEAKLILKRLCECEMFYALQWCAYEPCNESSFVHARCVAVLHQAVAIHLCLSSHEDAPHVFLRDDEIIQVAGSSSLRHMNLRDKLRWGAFLETFRLLLCQVNVLSDVITPRAEEFRSGGEGRDDATISVIRKRRSQFLLDNTHQVYTARYRCLFTILEYMWRCYFTVSDRENVAAALPPEVYAGGDAEAAALAQQQSDDCVKFFLEAELQALRLARRLFVEDDIRRKYWKHEMNIVMNRDYV
ncbi:protein farnesyltransferase alpha subunit, putative [Trypanosoma brucei brucei TREU927]|uniref:Protein farnesyltransferase/geranylgeranyltransferase type-1 subunit alpha n=1 Tax=Trypanosoma brucei brucei (strain 927/4 GUTat10.1) TaxID=185431 RepID=Q580J3_TRYB2|nr:protein farnesyltransferase alpha subunit, putative [Trypanosoma brucei brucei TREU927]AAX79303.1 protein farnesyltransferase alpha subunit, putative [Trypanosoma brucei]AAZ10482.1 protein farnesyltransferase alpha subunit, putative [Trypanosoma brucei brucei TREU927]